ncbi:MAG: 50S ribosomal protein L10 [Planctomycetes bacterium]|nr:50S ribosomal protein L10 [Planctomycetota bacterium]
MSKPVKEVISGDYQRRYADINAACVISVVGLDAISTNRLRGELTARKIRLQVVNNSLVRRALGDCPLGPLASALQGPCALVTGGDSIIDVAKTLVALKKTYAKIELKIGMVEGDPELLDVEQMAKLKSRVEMLGEAAMMILSPGRRLAGCISSPGGKIAGCVRAIIDKAEKAAAPAGEPAAA